MIPKFEFNLCPEGLCSRREPASRKPMIAAVPFACILLSIACSMHIGGPESPGPAITPDANPAVVQNLWEEALAQSVDGPVVIIFNESQLTAYLQEKLLSDPSYNLHDPQVYLRDGKIRVYGTLITGEVSASVLIGLAPSVKPEGGLQLEVAEAYIGPLELPKEMLSTISTSISEALTGQMGSLATGFRIKEVLVGDGQIAIRGEWTSLLN